MDARSEPLTLLFRFRSSPLSYSFGAAPREGISSCSPRFRVVPDAEVRVRSPPYLRPISEINIKSITQPRAGRLCVRRVDDAPPVSGFQRWKKSIAIEISVDFSEEKNRGKRQRLPIKLAATDAKNRRRLSGGSQRRFQVRRGLGAGSSIGRIARHDDVLALWQSARQRLPGFSPHDDGVACGQFPKMPKVLWQAPGQPPGLPDGAIARFRGNNGERKRAAIKVRIGQNRWYSV